MFGTVRVFKVRSEVQTLMAQPKIKEWTVAPANELGGAFPTDMLRYDSCWPATSEDAVRIGTSLAHWNIQQDKSATIRLRSYNLPTAGRWQSFGWTVKEVR